MTTTAAEPAVGSPIQDHQQLRDLPIGVVVKSKRRGTTYIKQENNVFSRQPDGYRFPVEFFGEPKNFVVESIPSVEPTQDFDLSDEANPAPTVTLARYQQRMRTVLMSAAISRLNDTASASRVLREAGCPEFCLSPGMVAAFHDTDLLRQLPVGTVLVLGDPADPNHHAVFGKATSDARLRRLLGTGQVPRGSHGCYEVESIPGVEPAGWFTAPPSDSEGEQIRAFQYNVWVAGQAEKTRHGWCGEYEQIMARWAGLTAAVSRPTRQASDGLTPADVRTQPVGSIIRFRAPFGSVLFRRDDSSNNPCRTVRVGGSIPGSWASTGMECVFTPGGRPMSIRAGSHEELDGMPTGTVITDGGHRWVKQGDSRWRNRNYGDRCYTRDFVFDYMHYVEFPTQEGSA